ncbi:hypothetical protein X975_14390, partial [Stegodyphus mimosarum]
MFATITPRFAIIFGALSVTGFSLSLASTYLRKKLEEKIGNQKLCTSAFDSLLQHKHSQEVLGSPISCRRPNLADLYNNITSTKAAIAIPVFGSKAKGNLLINANRAETDSEWTLESLKLKVRDEEIIIKE